MKRLLHLAVLSGLAAGAVLFTLHAADQVRRDLPGDYVEGVVLSAQLDAAQGRSPFDPRGWAEPPYRIHLYGPVFYELGGGLLGRVGATPTLVPGRLLSLAGLALALGSAFSIGRRIAGPGSGASLVGVLAPLSFLPVLIFAPQNRVDTLAAGLALAGLAVAMRGGRVAPALAALLFVLALFTKPTALAAPVALFLACLWRRRVRDAGILAGAAIVLGLAGLAAMQLTTGGGFVTAVFGFNGANPFSIGGLFKAVQMALGQPLLVVAAGLAIAGLVEGEPEERLVALYSLVALVLALATVGKVGANVNYFVEPGLAAAPVLALAWKRVHGTVRGLSLALALTAASLVVALPRVALEFRGRAERATAESTLRPVLSGRSVLTMEITSALRAGAVPYLNDPSIFACLTAAGRFDESRLVADLERGAIAVVLADSDLGESDPVYSNWSPAVRAAVVRHYELTSVLGRNLFLYQPPVTRP
ncbi:MAG: hypothetical protein KBF21_05605 [Thermoanaerobaculia bacterium]|nr:hypothetical protein [Thermoanaerobaculia bacterium]MBP9823681.1 hypothetical protein [Thermoanaerobaculia bacterium]